MPFRRQRELGITDIRRWRRGPSSSGARFSTLIATVHGVARTGVQGRTFLSVPDAAAGRRRRVLRPPKVMTVGPGACGPPCLGGYDFRCGTGRARYYTKSSVGALFGVARRAAAASRRCQPPLRRFAFANWDDDSTAHLES